jgi:site-specific recombinase XerD
MRCTHTRCAADSTGAKAPGSTRSPASNAAHFALYIRGLAESGLLRDSSICTMMHGVRGLFRFAHIDGLITADPAVYVRLPKVHANATRTQALDRLELIRFLQIAHTVCIHHGCVGLPAPHQTRSARPKQPP